MREVWRSRDAKLGREVAIKIVPAAFAADPDRLARLADYDVSPDGQRLLINTLVSENPVSPVTLLFNWTAKLKK